jgi:Flp pilus assembly protein protease CpaA
MMEILADHIELWGYLSMIVVLASTAMSNMRTFRISNIVGCLMFIVYASFKNATPVIVMNSCIIIIHLWHLFKKIN